MEILSVNVTFDSKFMKTNYTLEHKAASEDYFLTVETDFLQTFENLYVSRERISFKNQSMTIFIKCYVVKIVFERTVKKFFGA